MSSIFPEKEIKRFVASTFLVVGFSTFCIPLSAQVTPDDTLQGERSIVRRVRPGDLEIEGGARRNTNLFHSFQDFNIDDGGSVYFLNPDGVINIVSRVTGGNPSNILGTLGVRGNANLFLMNPNGILFGSNARLDINGSFVGTTANAIGFGELGFFSATNPEFPALLTVNPSAFLFNQISTGRITNNSIASTGNRTPSGTPIVGLQVPDGQNLLLVGGDINIDGGQLTALGGHIELGGVAKTGVIQLDTTGNAFNLVFPTSSLLSNVNLANDARVSVRGNSGGSIVVNANRFMAVGGGRLVAGVEGVGLGSSITVNANDFTISGVGSSGFGSGLFVQVVPGASGNSGNISINTQSFKASSGATLQNNVSEDGNGNSGNITVTANSLLLDRSRMIANGDIHLIGNVSNNDIIQASSFVLQNGTFVDTSNQLGGDSDNIIIRAGSISIDDAHLISGDESRSAGDISLVADGLILLSDADFDSSIEIGEGDPGNITIDAGSLIVRDTDFEATTAASESNSTPSGLSNGGTISFVIDGSAAFTGSRSRVSVLFGNGSGQAGAISIRAGSLSFVGSDLDVTTRTGGSAGSIFLQVDNVTSIQSSNIDGEQKGSGLPSNISLRSGSLFLLDGSTISASNVVGQEGIPLTAGNISIQVDDTFLMTDSAILSITTGFADGGQIDIKANSILLTDVSRISTGTSDNARGNAGNIRIQATESLLLTDNSFIASVVEPETQGDGGNITVQTQDLFLNRGSVISSSIAGEIQDRNTVRTGGQATQGGDISITAPRLISIAGVSSGKKYSDQSDFGFLLNPEGTSSGIYASTGRGATGRSGNITVNAGEFRILDRGVVNTQTFNASDGGDIKINAAIFEATDGGQVLANTFSSGSAGDITLSVTDEINLSGNDPDYANRLALFSRDVVANSSANSGLFTATEEGSTGNGGIITIQGVNSLTLNDSAQISSATSGTGNPGNIFIQNANAVALDDALITTTINPGAALSNVSSNQGNVDIQTELLSLTNRAQITTSTFGIGDAGNIRVRDADIVNLERSNIFTGVSSTGFGQGGDIDINTALLNLDRSNITASTSGRGHAGRITIQDTEQINLDRNSTISTTVSQGAIGNGGNITLDTDTLNLDRSNITANTAGQGDAGRIRIPDANTISLNDQSAISTTVVGEDAIGNGGSINIQTGLLTLNDRSRISSSTEGGGDTGQILAKASEGISLHDRSRITNRVEQGATGDSRIIRLNTPQLTLQDRSRISAATDGRGQAGDVIIRDADSVRLENSTISTAIENNGVVPATASQTRRRNTSTANQLGTIDLQTRTLRLRDGSRITASTQGQGNAGDIVVRNADTIAIDRSSISSEVGATSTGRGGNIELNTNSLDLNQGRISARTQAQGQGGTITVNADDAIESTDSNIETRSTNSSSGNVSLNADSIRLRGDSDIRTQVEQGEGIGGSITLSADSIVAYHDSDIVTRATEGQGGDITIDSPAFFAEGFIPDTKEDQDRNNRVDIDASGVQSGVVTTPDVSFIQNSLSDLPDSAIDSDQLLANSCIARTESGSTFLITGSGGLPGQPGNSAASTYSTGEVRSIPVESSTESWQPGDAIVEPQGVYRLPDGRLVMSRECQTQIH